MQYLEIVTPEVLEVVARYERALGVAFSAPDEDLGGARVAEYRGGLIGVRAPLAAHEQPIVRSYLQVDDIERAAKDAGAMIAYGPQKQGVRGTFAILISGGVQHGLWQR